MSTSSILSKSYDDDDEHNNMDEQKTLLFLLLACGALGALLMFIADLVLYYPSRKSERTAKSYFDKIDPGGNALNQSTMQSIPTRRVMCGGALGPVSSVFYSIGFCGIYLGFFQQQHNNNNSESSSFYPHPSKIMISPFIACLGLCFMMTIASSYHAVFVYTAFISKEIAKVTKEEEEKEIISRSLQRLIDTHRTYLKYIYKWAAIPGVIGSIAYIYAVLSYSSSPHSSTMTTCTFSRMTVFFVPIMSGPIKMFLKKKSIGGLVLKVEV